MGPKSEPPATFRDFVSRYPKIGQAWELCAEAGKEGPLSERSVRLAKLAMSMAAMREGAVHSGVRKALDLGIAKEEIEQLVSLLPGTIGFPAAVAVHTWVQDVLTKRKKG